MNSRLVPGVLIPDSDLALLLVLEECKSGSGKGPHLTFAFKNNQCEIYRFVATAGYLEAARLAGEVDKLGLVVERAFDPNSSDGVHGIYSQPLATGSAKGRRRLVRDGKGASPWTES